MISRIWAITLTVADLQRAVDFYEGVLGLEKKYQYRDYAGFDCGGVEIGLKTWGEREPPRAGEPCIDFAVPDVDRAVEELESRGVEILERPEDVQWGARIARVADPDGHVLQLTRIDWGRYFAANVPK